MRARVHACACVCVCVRTCVCDYTDRSVGPTHVVHLLGDPTKPVGDVGCKDNPTQLVSPTQHPQCPTTLSGASGGEGGDTQTSTWCRGALEKFGRLDMGRVGRHQTTV